MTLTDPLASPGAIRVTGVDGRFTFVDVAAGSYVLALVLPGFESREAPATVPAGGTAALEITMAVERLMESISVVAEEPRIFATNVVAEPMIAQQSTISSVLAVVDNLPGVSIQEGDTYGIDDWSTSVSMRGFQVHLDEAQIGTTIDGFPNGTSDYWSGSKAHRFIDQPNMGGVEVSQGTADIASRSVEALGGTFHVNQLYRAGWSIPRRNTFAYLKADVALSDTLALSTGAYYHRQTGRGDWLPPYLVNVTDDAGGPESELVPGRPVLGGGALGRLHFVGPDGLALAPRPGCVSSITFPYGGAGPEHAGRRTAHEQQVAGVLSSGAQDDRLPAAFLWSCPASPDLTYHSQRAPSGSAIQVSVFSA